MKTKETLTKCPEKSRTFLANRHEFCRKKRFGDGNLLVHVVVGQFDVGAA
jgi:hypothetical protein